MPLRPPTAAAWRRIGVRLLLVVAAVAAVAGTAALVVPFDAVPLDGSDAASACGPPVFEVMVPVDPAFAGPGADACAAEGGGRVWRGALALGGAVAVAVTVRGLAQEIDHEGDGRWLADRPWRARRRARNRSVAKS